MNRIIHIGVAGLLAVATLGSAPAALAKDEDVIKQGDCTKASTWKLKVGPEDGKHEVEFEVDQNKVGAKWRVVMRRDGNIFFQGKRTTKAPSGSFEVTRLAADPAGEDHLVARARNLKTGEICKGSVTV
jgi:hypothetical protein